MAKIGKVFLDFEAGTARFDAPIRKSNKQLAAVGKTARRSRQSFKNLDSLALGLGGRFLTLAGATVTLKSAFDNLRQFETLQARLKTAAGSARAATFEFGRLSNLAQGMASTIAEITDSFIKLKNFGLDSSENAMLSYANTAAALGKSLDQLIEAVGDAATKEFERLKEFGILARNQGDTIAFTFRGVTRTVENNSRAIQEFLIGLGNTEFAGSIADQMDTIDVKLSNLSDAWFRFTTTFGDATFIKKSATFITDSLNRISRAIDTVDLRKRIQEAGSFDVIALDDLTQAHQLLKGMNELYDARGAIVTKADRDAIVAMEARIALLEREAELNNELAATAARELANDKAILDMNALIDTELRKRLPKEQQLVQLKESQKRLIEEISMKSSENAAKSVNELRAVIAEIKKLEAATDDVNEKQKQAEQFAKRFNDSLSEGLARSILKARSLFDVLANVEQLAVDAIAQFLLPLVGGGGGGGGIGGFLGKAIFGGGRADGGPVQSGKSYLVGEKGVPELFTPASSGTVTPIEKLGNGSTAVTVINHFDINGDSETLQQMIAQSVEMSVKIAIAEGRNLKNRGLLA